MSITYADVTGTARLDGAAAGGRLRFVDPVSKARFFANAAGGGAFRARVTPGTYDVSFDPADPVVASGFYLVAKSLVLGADGAHDVALMTSPVSGVTSLDGSSTDGTTVFVDASSEEHSLAAASGTFAGKVAVGTYDVFFDSGFGRDLRIRTKKGAVLTGVASTLNAAIVQSTVAATVPQSAGVAVSAFAGLGASGERFRVVATGTNAYSGKLPTGTFDFFTTTADPNVAQARYPTGVPGPRLGTPADKAKPVSPGALLVTPVLRDVSVMLTVGGTPTVSNLILRFTERNTGTVFSALPVPGAGGTYTVRVAPGIYDITGLAAAAPPEAPLAACARID